MNETIPSSPQPIPPRPSRLWSWLRVLLLAPALLGTLVLLFYAVENWRGAAAWHRAEQELAADGLPTRIGALAPPPVPDAENLASATPFDRSLEFARDPQNSQWQNYDRAAANRWRTLRIEASNSKASVPKDPSWWEGERTDLKAWQQYYRQLAETPAKPDTRLPVLDPILAKRYGLPPNAVSNGVVNTHPVANPPIPPAMEPIPADIATRYGLATTNLTGPELIALAWFPVPETPGSAAVDVLHALQFVSQELDELAAEAARRPKARFAVNYLREPAAGITIPHLAKVKSLVWILRLRASARLENGAAPAALQDVLLSLRLSEAVAAEPFLISQLVRAAADMIALQPVWEGLQSHRWSDAELATLIPRLDAVDLLGGVPQVNLAEGLMYNAVPTHQLRTELAELMNASSGSLQPDLEDSARRMASFLTLYAPRGWFFQNNVQSLAAMRHESRLFQECLNSPALTNITLVGIAQHPVKITPYNFLRTFASPNACRRVVAKLIRAQTYLRLAVTACALERHRLATDALPESLTALVPRFLTRVPLDLMTGQPLIYRKISQDAFQLYSVGPDARDDGGNTAPVPESDNLQLTETPASLIGFDWAWPAESSRVKK